MQSLGATQHVASMGLERSFPKEIPKNNAFREQAKVLHTRSASMYDVTCAGEISLVIVYNGRSTDTLDSLRHQRFREKVASSATHVHPHTLPPTAGAAKYHSMLMDFYRQSGVAAV